MFLSALRRGFPPEPTTIEAALTGPEGPHWQAAMEEEIKNLTGMGT
jgi:hypothetical protein